MASTTPAIHENECHVCGGEIGTQYWVDGYPRLVHHQCRDWRRAPFPWEREIAKLRKLARKEQSLRPSIDETLRWLRWSRNIWPRGPELYDEGAQRLHALVRVINRCERERARAAIQKPSDVGGYDRDQRYQYRF